MDLGIAGKRALVLGGSKGLGRGIAEALAGEGVIVALTGRDATSAAKVAGDISPSARGYALDLSKPESLDGLLDQLEADFGAIDILVLNGGGPPPSPASVIEPDFWRAQFETMVLAGMRIAGRLLPGMRERQFGRIIAVASTSIREPIVGLTASNALRSAVAGWLKTLAGEVAADGVTVNLLLPGRLATDRTLSFDRMDAESEGLDIETVAARSQRDIPIGRYGTPAEFGAATAFLAGRQASYITGVALPIDGGLSRSML
ncbi:MULTISPECIES: SDR family oxidoreductase [unclassified Ensifer]|uniref:SDR family oxidoreductase n=1 Tax=unclassified Ensifer TaxID=2633371 RepID=UPI00071527B6|nr:MULTISPECIES: SDR family oxidoreductase [unclassified Ensifer]KQX54241.1 3-oxoacyl-ACP reductase [Ensifer sp. Root1298]KQX85929.1 3-oxoacyl-ACP reductase [Ensifer sp. Root1312]KRC22989.1 3-oxoacyl-ACP reductase [Ensifer sp. Root74]KRD57240.1 3-oxoacyl-ACP reductase [Ensifer sp. Root954]